MRKKIDPRLSDTRRTKSSGNVFLDLDFDPAEAKVMALRAEVMIRIEQHLKAQGWTQAEAGERLGLSGRQVRRMEAGDAPIARLHKLACEAVSAREAA